MATMIEVKGIHRVKIRKNGKTYTYHYAWRGGPKLRGKEGSPEYIASYNAAIEERRTPEPGKFTSVVTKYKASPDFKNLSESTKKEWSRWLDRISDHFGPLRIEQFNRPEKIRPIIRKWRNKYADTPRQADMGIQVLSRVCSYAVDPMGKLASNPAEGIKQLYSSDRSEIIWSESDIQQLKRGSPKRPCSEEIGHAVDLAATTGLRLSDLLRLSWSHVGEDATILPTSKSRGRREAIIPLYDELRDVLNRIPKRSTTILTSSKGRPWTADGFGSSFNKAKHEAGMAERDLHFHDLRGNAATKFYNCGLSIRVIAEVMAWEEETVERIIRRYVGRSSATKEAIRQINEARNKNKKL